MQIDFNPLSGSWNDEELWEGSYITMNGINYHNIKYQHEIGGGVVYIDNHQHDGKWLITTEDVKVSDQSVFRAFKENGSCPAVLATALNSIKMPEPDFVYLG